MTLQSRAYSIVGTHRMHGMLTASERCQECGADNPVAHHDDYAKPLDVRWLCRKCHKAWHSKNKAENAGMAKMLVNARLDRELYDKVRVLLIRDRISFTALIDQMCREYVDGVWTVQDEKQQGT